MLDIETLGLRDDAIILSVGAVKFDPQYLGNTPDGPSPILDGFYVAVDPEDAARHGGTTTVSTLQWWLHPDRQAAWKELQEMRQIDLFSALDGLALWMRAESDKAQTTARNLIVWGNSPSFDCAKLKNSMARVGVDCPWEFRKERDLRTIASLDWNVRKPNQGTAHTALADATNQAVHVQLLVQKLGLTL